MKPIFVPEEFRSSENCCISFENVEQARIFFDYFKSLGYKWSGVTGADDDEYFQRESEMDVEHCANLVCAYNGGGCYDFLEGGYCDEEWFSEVGYRVVYFDDFSWGEPEEDMEEISPDAILSFLS